MMYFMRKSEEDSFNSEVTEESGDEPYVSTSSVASVV